MPKRLSRSDESGSSLPDLTVSDLGQLVREKRTSEQLSVRQAAAQAGVSFSTVSRVEAGAQPDLATFLSLSGWLGLDPGRFFSPVTQRTQTPLDQAIEHLVTDPSLSPDDAERIASVVRDLHKALAHATHELSDAPMTLHLRAAAVMRPGVPERLAAVLKDMRQALEESTIS